MRINQKQKYVIIGGLLLIVVMVLFPPWYVTARLDSGIAYLSEHATYCFILGAPPQVDQLIDYRIDTTKLWLQGLVVVALTAVGLIVFSKETERDS